MNEVFVFTLIVCGWSNILANMKVSRWMRLKADGQRRSNWVSQMLSCCACNGFWLGFLLYWLNFTLPMPDKIHIFSSLAAIEAFTKAILEGGAASCAAWTFFVLTDWTGVYDRH